MLLTSDPLRRRARQVRVVHALVLAALPIVLLLLNDSWAFTPPLAGLDPWFYTGFFLHFPEHLRTFAGTYYVARLPHVLAGAAAYHLFDPPFAAYALRLLYWYAAVFALYGTIWQTLRSPLAAFVTSVLFGTSTYFLWAIGWDYVDGAVVVCLMAASFCLTWAGPRRAPFLAPLAGGGFQLLAVSTYVGILILLPVQIAYALVVWMREQRRLLPLAWIVVGWVAGFGVLGCVNWFATGTFNYLEPQFRAAVAQSAGREQYVTGFAWLLRASWLVMPAIASACALTILAQIFRQERSARARLAEPGAAEALVLLAAVGIFALMELRGFWMLQLQYTSSYLMPFSALALGAAFARGFAAAGPRWHIVAPVCVVAAAVLPFTPAIFAWYPRCTPDCVPWPSIGWTLFLVAAAGMIAMLLIGRTTSAVAAASMFAMVNLVFADPRALEISRSAVRREGHATVIAASRLASERHEGRPVRFWYDFTEDLGQLYRSISSTYIWSFSLVGEDFPMLAGRLAHDASMTAPTAQHQQDPGLRVSDNNTQLAPNDALVLLTARPLHQVKEVLRQHGLDPGPIREDALQYDGRRFSVLTFTLQPTGEARTIPLDRLTAAGGRVTRTSISPPVASVVTPPQPSAYGAIVELQDYINDDIGRADIGITVTDVRGRLGLCVLNLEETACLGSKVIDEQTSGTAYVSVRESPKASKLVITSWDQPESSEVSISAISVVQRAEEPGGASAP